MPKAFNFTKKVLYQGCFSEKIVISSEQFLRRRNNASIMELFCENSYNPLAVTYFLKRLSHRHLAGSCVEKIQSPKGAFVPWSSVKKVFRPQVCNFIKKETLAQVFSVNFAEVLKTPFIESFLNTFRWLLLLL